MRAQENARPQNYGREKCTRIFARRNMTRMVCDKKMKPGRAGLHDAFQSLSMRATRDLAPPLLGPLAVAQRVLLRCRELYFAAASLAIECESRDTFRLAWFL